MGMIAMYRYFIGNIVKYDDSIEKNKSDKDQQSQRDIIQHESSLFARRKLIPANLSCRCVQVSTKQLDPMSTQ
jgi:hypothetical protein